ncbi:MAG TPA: hypothetical protein VJJ78_00235, partial [Candidatus Saccharimonadales bacterium]|nr:hypothetical protein [Candidatus Saccharimonadales bacterium]
MLVILKSSEIFKDAGLSNKVTGIATAEYYKDKPEAAKRPLNSVLELAKIKATGFEPHDWRQ